MVSEVKSLNSCDVIEVHDHLIDRSSCGFISRSGSFCLFKGEVNAAHFTKLVIPSRCNILIANYNLLCPFHRIHFMCPSDIIFSLCAIIARNSEKKESSKMGNIDTYKKRVLKPIPTYNVVRERVGAGRWIVVKEA